VTFGIHPDTEPRAPSGWKNRWCPELFWTLKKTNKIKGASYKA
jgi:hypothetical protein